MFQTNYIHELISGKLSIDGYKHFINTIFNYVKKFSWPKSIIVSSDSKTIKHWSVEDIKELTHEFFEWTLTKGKFHNLNKIHESYLSYYFSQILISFVANRIKEEQQKEGLNFSKCRELVISICNEDYIVNMFDGNQYCYKNSFSKQDLKPFEEVYDVLTYLSKIPIKESTKQFRPLVKLAIEDIFGSIESPMILSKLIEIVYNLFDQSRLKNLELKDDYSNALDLETSKNNFEKIIQIIVSGLTHEEAKMISHYLFNNETEQSLAEIAEFYNIPKSTLHHKIDSFKKKIARSYTPINETDGIIFIQNIAQKLDKLSK
ncbi:MAG: hypothetical protein K9I82_15370 [Chitinophagaceae bacterium]|nr:hypothetical protein [Chitinophagaceae bacterium]